MQGQSKKNDPSHFWQQFSYVHFYFSTSGENNETKFYQRGFIWNGVFIRNGRDNNYVEGSMQQH